VEADGRFNLQATLLDGLGNRFPQSRCYGEFNIALRFDTDLAGAGAALARYDALLVASHWNAQLLRPPLADR
jgi:hypothetical protein